MSVSEVVMIFIVGLIGLAALAAGHLLGGYELGEMWIWWLIVMMGLGAFAGFRAGR